MFGAYIKTTIHKVKVKENQRIQKQSALFRHAFNNSNLETTQNTCAK